MASIQRGEEVREARLWHRNEVLRAWLFLNPISLCTTTSLLTSQRVSSHVSRGNGDMLCQPRPYCIMDGPSSVPTILVTEERYDLKVFLAMAQDIFDCQKQRLDRPSKG